MALFDAIISHDLPIFQFLSIAVHNLLLRGYSGLHLDHLLHLGHWAGPAHLELGPLPLITRLHQNQGQLLITGLHHLQGEVDGCLLVDAIRWQSSLGLQGLRAQLEDLVLNGNLSPRPDMFFDLIHSVSRMGSEGHWSPLLRVDSHLDKKRPRDSCLDCLPSSTPTVPTPSLLPHSLPVWCSRSFTTSRVLPLFQTCLLKLLGYNARKPVFFFCNHTSYPSPKWYQWFPTSFTCLLSI